MGHLRIRHATPIYPPIVAGNYYRFGGTSLSTAVATQSRLRLTPVYIWQACTLDRLGAEVTTGAGSSTVRLGVYADDGNFRPTGAALLDAGTIDGNSATVQTLTVSLALSPGWYWFGSCAQGGTPTLRVSGSPPLTGGIRTDYGTSAPAANTVAYGWYMDAVTGALPTLAGLASSGSSAAAFHGRLS